MIVDPTFVPHEQQKVVVNKLSRWEQDHQLLIPWFLMACYAYYELGKPIMTDVKFDKLLRLLHTHWDTVVHPHKELINLPMLEAGTGFDLEYTNMIRYATMDLIKEQDESR